VQISIFLHVRCPTSPQQQPLSKATSEAKHTWLSQSERDVLYSISFPQYSFPGQTVRKVRRTRPSKQPLYPKTPPQADVSHSRALCGILSILPIILDSLHGVIVFLKFHPRFSVLGVPGIPDRSVVLGPIIYSVLPALPPVAGVCGTELGAELVIRGVVLPLPWYCRDQKYLISSCPYPT